ncbi:MAG: DNA polymerase III subunit beta [Eggerthellaceae bacterium]|nr:DNA polymerase III subunit beta [Eggerthellaceae bacterium]
MKFIINKTELLNALNVVTKGISSKSTLPALSGVLLDATGDTLVMQSSDLDLSIRARLSALVEEEGKALIPGKLFSDIIKTLPDASVEVIADDAQALITCGISTFDVKTLVYEDFPAFPQIEPDRSVKLPFSKFSPMVKRVSRAVSKDDSRAVLKGVLITLESNVLTMVATDSFRLALEKAEVPETAAEPFSVIVAGPFLNDIANIQATDDEIQLATAENQILVNVGNIEYVNRRILGDFPYYQQLISPEVATRVEFDRTELSDVIKRISRMSLVTTPTRVDIDADVDQTTVSVQSRGVGSVKEIIPTQVEGEGTQIGFNCNYISDGLAIMPTQKLYLEIAKPGSAGIFRADEPADFLYLVMPMRL